MKDPVIELNGWLTIKAAAEKYGYTTQVLTNWIKRGKLPCKEFPELNGLRLVHPDLLPGKG